jgi:prepilin-type processing-associated H-X9-DG protein
MGYINDPPDGGYQTFRKLSSIAGSDANTHASFGPAQALVFVDEKDNSIDDGEFDIEMAADELINIPAAYHAGAGLVSFADGHAEIHPWVTQEVLQPPPFGGVVIWGNNGRQKDQFKSCAANNQDMLWLQAHATFATP